MEDQEGCSHGHSDEVSPKGIDSIGDTPKTPLLLDGDLEGNKEKMKAGLKKRFNVLNFSKKEKIKLDSIYSITDAKDMKMKLSVDSTAMGFAVFMKKEHLQLNLSAEQQSDVFMNSMIV